LPFCIQEVDKAKHEYHDLQKTMQQIATKTTSEKSKLETYEITESLIHYYTFNLVNIVKNVIWLKLVLIHYNKKKNNIENSCRNSQAIARKGNYHIIFYFQHVSEKVHFGNKFTLSLNANICISLIFLFRIADLQAALFRMKQQYETAQKRIREETELKNKFEQDLIREQQRIQELTIQNDQQQKILKLKTEGLVAAQRKLRGAPNGNATDGTTTTNNFEVEMEKLVSERKELETLRDDVKKREELIQKRELLLNERTELEAKKMRTSQVLNKV
jgi:hypothetical protein